MSQRALVVLLDGLGDLPHQDLQDQTPLQAASTPWMDQLAAEGSCGWLDPILPGVPVRTHTAVALLLGMAPREALQLRRGPVEAAGSGMALRPGDVALRCNFATVSTANGNRKILDRRAGRLQQGQQQLADAVNALCMEEEIHPLLQPTRVHRAVLKLSGAGLSAEISDTDPGSEGQTIQACRPRRAGDMAADRTARFLNRFLQASGECLQSLPFNQELGRRGLPQANAILTRGAGLVRPFASLIRETNLKAAVVAGDPTVLGLGRLLGMESLTAPGFNTLPNTDLDGKVALAKEALQNHDVVVLHVKGTDTCSHDRNPQGKAELLERCDRALADLPHQDWVVAVTGDHTTDSLKGDHCGAPVPLLLRAPGHRRDPVQSFHEGSCGQGHMGRVPGWSFLWTILDAMRVAPNYRPRLQGFLGWAG
ncbi:MAG: 2,3-bisphosphoglycerate-independent phosphoglycerate mutase [Planctomycetota bacterium]|nr:MAG: 2,3-bisphosphoglycerate-independent phosphoglycerate mutase [Planctomycetota bacterium]